MSMCLCLTFICVLYTEAQIIWSSCVLHCTLYSSTEYLYMNLCIKSAMWVCVCLCLPRAYDVHLSLSEMLCKVAVISFLLLWGNQWYKTGEYIQPKRRI